MTDKTDKALEAIEGIESNIDADLEYLEDTFFSDERRDFRSIDYEFGSLELTTGDLKKLKAILELAKAHVKANALNENWLKLTAEKTPYSSIAGGGS